MKSKIFENINDRGNITNAYLKIVNESFESIDKDELKEKMSKHGYDYNEWDSCDDAVVDVSKDGEKEYRTWLVFDSDSGRMTFNSWNEVSEWLNGVVFDDGDIELDPQEISDIKDTLDKWHIDYEVNADGSITWGINGIVKGKWNSFYDALRYIEKRQKNEVSGVGESEAETEAETEDANEGWFDNTGYMVKELPEQCIIDCSQGMGHDCYEDCKGWVEQIGFDKNLDIGLAKGFLKSTGGWEKEEISKWDAKETAIRLLWVICGDIKDGMETVYIGDGGRFDESVVNEYTYHAYKVVLTNIGWSDEKRDEAESKGYSLPSRDAMSIETCDGEDIDDAINSVYIDSFGIAPDSYKVAKQIDLGTRSDRNESCVNSNVDKGNEIKKLKNDNPDIESINEIDKLSTPPNRIVRHLMRKEELSREDAENWYNDTMDSIVDLIGNGDYESAIMMFEDEFELEPDYMEDAVASYRKAKQTNESMWSEEHDENYYEFPIPDQSLAKYGTKQSAINFIHRTTRPYVDGFFTDNDWSGVRKVIDAIEALGCYVLVSAENRGIRSDGLRASKVYGITMTWTNKNGKKMMVKGELTCMFCGTVEDPESRYDMAFTMW